MVDMKIERPQLSLAQLKPLLPVVIVGSLLLAGWFGWSGWEQHRDGARRVALQQARDTAVQQVQAAIAADPAVADLALKALNNLQIQQQSQAQNHASSHLAECLQTWRVHVVPALSRYRQAAVEL